MEKIVRRRSGNGDVCFWYGFFPVLWDRFSSEKLIQAYARNCARKGTNLSQPTEELMRKC